MSDALPTKPAPGVCVTLYADKRPDRALTDDARRVLARACPEIVMVHASPRAILGIDPANPQNKGAADAMAAVRQLLPHATLWVGIGCDGWTDEAAQGRVDEAVSKLSDAALYAADHGASCVIWDAEAASESAPLAASKLAVRVIEDVAKRRAELTQGFTSYPIYTVHSKLPFAAWHHAPVALTIPQLYAAGKRAAKPGELQGVVRWHRNDRKHAVERGMVPRDVAWAWYLQAHSTPPEDTIAVCSMPDAAPLLCFWAAPTRMDADGERAIIQVCDTRRVFGDKDEDTQPLTNPPSLR